MSSISQPIWDTTFEEWVVPTCCPCCQKCWLIVRGKSAGRCVHGGPYKGYIDAETGEPL